MTAKRTTNKYARTNNNSATNSGVEQQKPHDLRVKTIDGTKYEHQNVYHGFDGDDLLVISAGSGWSYIYPRRNIVQIAVSDCVKGDKNE